jgi:anti-sigma regulatory factor (Ser/Thr protein kinase)
MNLQATLEALTIINEYVVQVANRAHLDHRAAYQLRLAVDEIATNVVYHGSSQTPHEVVFKIETDMDDEYLMVILEDTGQPYNPYQAEGQEDLHQPLEQRRFGGLGVYLALHSVDELKYERLGEWNRHTFIVKRDSHDSQ